MNWQELNKKHPLAFLGWVNETIQFNGSEVVSIEFSEMFGFLKGLNSEGGVEFTCYELTDNDIYSFPYYFDSLGIHIIPKPHDIKNSTNWVCEYYNQKAYMGYLMNGEQIATFPDRLTATIAGIEEAFEILEEQLKLAQDTNQLTGAGRLAP